MTTVRRRCAGAATGAAGVRCGLQDCPPTSAWSLPHLQRRAEARQDPGWVQAALADPDTCYLMSLGTTHLVRREPHAQIAFLGPEHPLIPTLDAQRLVLLG